MLQWVVESGAYVTMPYMKPRKEKRQLRNAVIPAPETKRKTVVPLGGLEYIKYKDGDEELGYSN